MKKTAVLFLFVLCSNSFGQNVHITGVVRDINTHREIRGVNIYVKDTGIGTSADVSGQFEIVIPEAVRAGRLVFKHIAYYTRAVAIDSMQAGDVIYLQPRVIPLPGVEIEGEGQRPTRIGQDLPQTYSTIEAKRFEIRGYVDAGDLLQSDHSVQINEELSGKKTASIRGGNADEVIVLYNGVKMNNAFDNIYDLAQIDLEDVERFEIIKGSHTALYGPEAFSGVINIVPKTEQDYHIRFQQRIGTYRSGNWGLHLFHSLGRFDGNYSLKRGGFKRDFLTSDVSDTDLVNRSTNHTANLNYAFSDQSSLGAMFLSTTLDYDNRRDRETLSNLNQLFTLKFDGNLWQLSDVDFAISYKRLQEEQTLNFQAGTLDRDIADHAFQISANKQVSLDDVDFVLGYQFLGSRLDFTDRRQGFDELDLGLESALLERRHHGIVSVMKYHGETDSDFLQSLDLDLSVRHDRVQDRQRDASLRQGNSSETTGLFRDNNWNETMLKFSLKMSGYRENLAFDGYLNFGKNIKFPTLFQQISAADESAAPGQRPNLSPEKNRSMEIGARVVKDMRTEPVIHGWQLAGNFFRNFYENKFRTFTTIGVPVLFYDNVQDAEITGLEGSGSLYFLHKKLTVQVGYARYFISDKAAFPFKSDFKRTVDVLLDHAGYALQIHWFKEGDQAGWLRPQDGDEQIQFFQITLPGYTNVDVHLSKTFRLGKFELFGNFSGRNLLRNDQFDVSGLAIRDRRFYLTMGAQY